MKLYATKEKVNGHEWVNVSADPDEASHRSWRALGYVPEDEVGGAEESAGGPETMTVAELEEFVESEGLDVVLSDHRLKADKVAAVEAALAAREATE